MLKRLSLAVLSLATITACAHPMTNLAAEVAADEQAAYHLRGLYHTSISGGTYDDVGQVIPLAQEPDSLGHEASAAPVHE